MPPPVETQQPRTLPGAPRYRELAPRAELSELVTCTWERELASDGDAREARILPDGSVDLVWEEAGGLFVAGPDTRAWTRTLGPGALVVGLRLRPGVAGRVLELPASELRDARVPLDLIWGARTNQLTEELAATPGPQRQRGLLEEALLRRLPDIRPPDPLAGAALRHLGRPDSKIGALSDTLFVSDRHLRRVFRDAVGYAPKTLDRVLRFQRLLARGPAVRSGTESLARVAVELGYADQAHLTRDCVDLSGLTPKQLLESWSPGASVAIGPKASRPDRALAG